MNVIKNKKSINTKGSQRAQKEQDTIFHQVEEYIGEHYDLRHNLISQEIEISKKGENKFTKCNEDSLYIELNKAGFKFNLNRLISLLKSDYPDTFHPFRDYFENLPEWDRKTMPIKQFSRYVRLVNKDEQGLFYYHLQKWAVRAVKCATIDSYYNKQAIILSDNGRGQNLGKSTWCRFLCPPKLGAYIAEDMGTDKDSRILLTRNFLINLDELGALEKRDRNKIKSYFSKEKVNERLPYGRTNTLLPRVANFIGSTNLSQFLSDETGSVRWLCFDVESIDWKYKEEFDIDDFWAEAYARSKDPSFDERITNEDIAINEKRNVQFTMVSTEQDLIQKYYEPGDEEDEFMSASDIIMDLKTVHFISITLYASNVGKALHQMNFPKAKRNGRSGYWIKRLE